MKTKILSILLISILFGAVGFKYYQFKNPDKFQEPTTITQPNSSEAVTLSSTATAVSIEVPEPVSGIRKGVIEVGASGFNSFIVLVDKQKRWKLISKTFGASNAYEGFTSVKLVQLGLQEYISQMFEKGVDGKNIHFMISSGALKNPKTKIIVKGIQELGYIVNQVTPEQEGNYAFMSTVPPAYRNKAIMVDIGSGNTKISYIKNGELQTIESYGAKYYQRSISDSEVRADIVQKTIGLPTVEYVFILGGVPYQLAKASGINGRYSLLKAPEDLKLEDNEKNKAGMTIYSALYNSIDSQWVFDQDSNFTIGFLLNL